VSFLETTAKFGQVRRLDSVGGQAVAYQPQPGDILLFDSQSMIMKGLYFLAGTQLPDHAGIVVPRPDGRPALLEAGPMPNFHVRMEDVMGRLRAYTGSIWIRRFSGTLTAQQAAKLKQFAIEQTGKRFAVGRFIMQGTPFQSRRLLRLFAKTCLNRSSWLCSELVVAAAASINLLDPAVVPATTVYPLDILKNKPFDLNRYWSDAALWRLTCPMVRSPRRQPSGPVHRPLEGRGRTALA
jgi:hypothetical protein